MTTAGSLPVPNNWINDNYGSKKGLLNYSLHESKRLLGFYSSLKVDRHANPKRIVFVCVGNICRSPLAEAIAKSRGYNAISYGLDTRGNDGADPRAIQFAAQNNLDLTGHRTRRIDEYKEQNGDLIVGMEPKHLKLLRKNKSNALETLLGIYRAKPRAYIHDPYNTNGCYFSQCEQTVWEATEALLDYVQ